MLRTSRLAADTEELALRIAEASAMAIGIGKQAFYEQIDMGDEKALAYGARTIALNCLAEDERIGTPFWRNQRRSGRTDRTAWLSLDGIIREGGVRWSSRK